MINVLRFLPFGQSPEVKHCWPPSATKDMLLYTHICFLPKNNNFSKTSFLCAKVLKFTNTINVFVEQNLAMIMNFGLYDQRKNFRCRARHTQIPFCLQFNKKNAAFTYDLFWHPTKRGMICKTLHFGQQNPWFWLAICRVLQRKMHAFDL